MLSFPSHCTHRLQPLKRSIYGPFKKYFNTVADEWHLNNPGKVMTIYDLPALVAIAYTNAVTPSNIQAGFKPKTHKTNVPLQPILSMTGSSHHELRK